MTEYRCRALRVVVLALVLAAILPGQINLTTIDDTIYRADGQRFDGYAQIEWHSFQASDQSSISANSKTVRVVNGALKVSLVPTTTASAGAYYLVKYTINGRLQTTEYWAVRPSTASLKLKDVRLAGPPAGGSPITGGVSGPIALTDVLGLTDELAARARKGLAFIPPGAAIVNANGELETASGQPTDCVKVNGTTGPCGTGGGGASFVDAEVPAGLINGTNTAFTLANAPVPTSSLQLYVNGVLQKAGADFSLTNNVITFVATAIPQPGDSILSSYRLGAAGQVNGQAGGSLVGFFPAPSIAPGAITDLHVSATAAISETKLALNFPTHSNANDPNTDQKAALTGTVGSPSNANRFVTDQDPRLTNARPPAAHALLSGSHFDSNPGSVARGDLLVGQGTNPTLWTRLPLGGANRCLISNGADAVWNACLFTGFPAGSLPFVDATGNLAHNNSRLFWDNSLRRMGIGTGSPVSTLTVFDAALGDGSTTLTVRAGQGQQTNSLQQWQDTLGSVMAEVAPDGSVRAPYVKTATSASQAAWQELGSAFDPASQADGSSWFNTIDKARRGTAGGVTHSVPQVLCSISGISTNSTTAASLGSCLIPAALIRPGDRFEVHFDLTHEGTATGFSYAVNWATSALASRSGAASEVVVVGKGEVVPQGPSGYCWNTLSWGASSTLQAGAGCVSVLTGDILVDVKAQMAAATTTETVTLRSLTVVRLPKTNP